MPTRGFPYLIVSVARFLSPLPHRPHPARLTAASANKLGCSPTLNTLNSNPPGRTIKKGDLRWQAIAVMRGRISIGKIASRYFNPNKSHQCKYTVCNVFAS